ncbi:TIGR04222 domain-containing membrane protein [Streptomyces sp. NPDC046821]|uniref:TIGR04222 domain-containing membrane protein n=1 Tax=Streptomyces sp. NPDC046821 TaxID=3154702 RepID=UPI0033E70CD7
MLWVLFLLMACAAAFLSCARLCLAAVHAAASEPAGDDGGHELTLYEAAFLSGGPYRVVDLTLVSMARSRRLWLAHTGWATVVDPVGGDDLERSVIGAIGPEGQSRIGAVRRATVAADAVRAVADRLVAAGLAVPHGARTGIMGAVRQVRGAALACVGLATASLLMPDIAPGDDVLIVAWFSLPLALTLACLAIARYEAHPYTSWASPAGQRLIGALPKATRTESADAGLLTAVAMHGVRAVPDAALRSAFSTAQRGH